MSYTLAAAVAAAILLLLIIGRTAQVHAALNQNPSFHAGSVWVKLLTIAGFGALVAVMLALRVAHTGSTNSEPLTLSPEGLGPHMIGMRSDKVAECEEVTGSKGVRLMYEKGVLTRITLVAGSEYKTREGVAVGDSEETLEQAYHDRLTVIPHKYDENGHYFKTRPNDDKGYVFETDGSKVVQIHAGRYPAVAYVEGCL